MPSPHSIFEDIKSEPMTVKQVEEMKQLVGSYEALFSKRATLYKEMGLMCPHEMSKHFIQRLGIPWKEFMVKKTLMHTPLGEYKHKSLYQ